MTQPIPSDLERVLRKTFGQWKQLRSEYWQGLREGTKSKRDMANLEGQLFSLGNVIADIDEVLGQESTIWLYLAAESVEEEF